MQAKWIRERGIGDRRLNGCREKSERRPDSNPGPCVPRSLLLLTLCSNIRAPVRTSSSCFILLNLTSWVKEASVAFSGQTNGSVFALGSRDYSKAFWEDWNNWQLEGVRTMYSLYEDAQESRIRKRSTWTFSYRMRVLSESTWKATPYVAGLKTLIPTTVWQSRLILYEFHSFSLSIAGQ